MANRQKTQDKDKIRAWVTARHGIPVEFDHPDAQADKTGIRIDFPGIEDELLHNQAVATRKLSWDEFFAQLEQRNLSFVFDEQAGPDDDLTLAYHFEPTSE